MEEGGGRMGGARSPSLGWQSIAADQQVSGRKLEAISCLILCRPGVDAAGRPWILFVIYG